MIRCPIRKYKPLKADLKRFVQAVIDYEPVPFDWWDGLAALGLGRTLIQPGI
jgi:hypothetical protein